MRVCPKCEFIDPPHWKHAKFSYHIDHISPENFGLLYPELAKQLTKGGMIVEDKHYYYRLTNTKSWIHRKAKIDCLDEKPFGAEKYEKFNHISACAKQGDKISYTFRHVHPNQTKLFEESKP